MNDLDLCSKVYQGNVSHDCVTFDVEYLAKLGDRGSVPKDHQ